MNVQIRQLSKAQYLGTMSDKMLDITEAAELSDDIWDYAGELLCISPISEDGVLQRQLESVYENDEHTFRHILLFGNKKNCYVVIVVDIADNSVLGFYSLDLNEEYGINE